MRGWHEPTTQCRLSYEEKQREMKIYFTKLRISTCKLADEEKYEDLLLFKLKGFLILGILFRNTYLYFFKIVGFWGFGVLIINQKNYKMTMIEVFSSK